MVALVMERQDSDYLARARSNEMLNSEWYLVYCSEGKRH